MVFGLRGRDHCLLYVRYCISVIVLTFIVTPGFLKFASRLWRNSGSWLYSPQRLDWGEQIVVITGGKSPDTLAESCCGTLITTWLGASGIGALLANTLAVRNVTVVVLDVNPIVTENCESHSA